MQRFINGEITVNKSPCVLRGRSDIYINCPSKAPRKSGEERGRQRIWRKGCEMLSFGHDVAVVHINSQ